jgi:hypothetical protein
MTSLVLPDGSGGNATITVNAVAGTATITLPTGTANLLSTVLAAGSTTVPSLKFSSGNNLTTATAGSWEYDGRAFYLTPQSTQRAVMPTMQLCYLGTGITGGNDTTTRSIFNQGVTLASNTVYVMEAMIYMSRSTGTTSHRVNMSFGGTATLNNITITGSPCQTVAGNVVYQGASEMYWYTNTTAQPWTGTMTTANAISTAMRVTIDVNAGGTFIPQYAATVAPGGAYTVGAGSYMIFWPMGASGNITVGAWS